MELVKSKTPVLKEIHKFHRSFCFEGTFDRSPAMNRRTIFGHPFGMMEPRLA